ncbi:MAG TPA: FkbM family methyltransferase [Baekduia sp.]|nr:FkbM family methyltransferase [Baekduia sp.]
MGNLPAPVRRGAVTAIRRLPPRAVRRLPGRRLRSLVLPTVGDVLGAYPVAFERAPTHYGFELAGTTEDLLQRNVYLFGVWEPHISRWVHDFLREGDVVVDIGANVGWFSLLCARRVGPRGRVVAFEPVPSIVEALQRNLALNDIGWVDVHACVAGDEPGTAEIFRGTGDNLGLSSTEAAAGAASEGVVARVRGADVVPAELWSRVRLVKADTEGDELRALRGLEPLLRAMPAGAAALVEVTPDELRRRGQTAQEIVDLLRGAGFDRMAVVPNSYESADYAGGDVLGPQPIAAAPDDKADVLFVKGA